MQVIEALTQLMRTYQNVITEESFNEVKTSPQMGWACARDGVSASRMDGLVVDEDSILASWDPVDKKLIGTHQSASEQLVLNALEVASEAETLAKETITGAFIMGIAEKVWGTVEPWSIQTEPMSDPRLTMTPIALDKTMSPPTGLDNAGNDEVFVRAEAIADYLSGRSAASTDLDLVRLLSASDVIHTYLPLGPISSLVGKIVQKVLLYQLGMPLLSWVPLNTIRASWEAGASINGVSYSKETIQETQRHEQSLALYDVTAFQTINLQLALHAMQEFQQFAIANAERYREVKRALATSSYFNQRQRSILARAAKGANREFTIRYHEQNNAISYATARRDFQELVDSGFLESRFDGNTQIFFASSDFEMHLTRTVGIPGKGLRPIPPCYLPPNATVDAPAPKSYDVFPSH